MLTGMANVTVTLSNPLLAHDAVRIGLTNRDYNVGESITISESNADNLRGAGIIPPVSGGSAAAAPRSAFLSPPVAKTASYTLLPADSIIVMNGTTLTATLPSAVTAATGRTYWVKNINASAVTLAATAGTIDGAATKTLAQWAVARVVSDGTNWLTL